MLKLPAKRHGQDKEDSGLGAKMLVVVGVPNEAHCWGCHLVFWSCDFCSL